MSLAPTGGLRAALGDWLDHERALKGVADNTITAYRTDVSGWLSFLMAHHGEGFGVAKITTLTISDMRAWMAHERGRGSGPRSLARALSAVKGFTRWLAEREGFDATAILSTRAPKYQRKLPRPLSADAARDMIGTVAMQHDEPWIAARDSAVITVLYGCGVAHIRGALAHGRRRASGRCDPHCRQGATRNASCRCCPPPAPPWPHMCACVPMSLPPMRRCFAANAAGRSTRARSPK